MIRSLLMLLLLLTGCVTYQQGDCVKFSDPPRYVMCEAVITGDSVLIRGQRWYVVERTKCYSNVPNVTLVSESDIKPSTRCPGW